MRRPKYLSPSSITAWVNDPSTFYLRYMSDTPPPREGQNHHMAIGASFDAHVKAELTSRILGKREGMSFQEIFESQVEPHNRTKEIIEGGRWLYDWYGRLGALSSLVAMLGKTIGPPRFEMDVRGEIHSGKEGEIKGVPFRVKPDLFFINEHGARVILDWKVNGFFSNSGHSPKPGYALLRTDGERPSPHADCRLAGHKGIFVNQAKGMEFFCEEWARQLTVGAWLCGEEVGSDFVGVIHQLVCRPGSPNRPRVRVAEHAAFISKDFQAATHSLAREIWETVNSDHVFRNLTKEESKAKCELLDGRRDADSGPESIHDPTIGLEEIDPWRK